MVSYCDWSLSVDLPPSVVCKRFASKDIFSIDCLANFDKVLQRCSMSGCLWKLFKELRLPWQHKGTKIFYQDCLNHFDQRHGCHGAECIFLKMCMVKTSKIFFSKSTGPIWKQFGTNVPTEALYKVLSFGKHGRQEVGAELVFLICICSENHKMSYFGWHYKT